MLRDPNEYAGRRSRPSSRGVAARARGDLPGSTEELGLGIAAAAIDAIRRAEGLAPTRPATRCAPRPASASSRDARRGRAAGHPPLPRPGLGRAAGELPAWWPGREDEPLVYVTFGSVAGSFPQALPAYGVALSAVAELPVARAPHGRPRPRPRRAARRARQRARGALGAAAGRARPTPSAAVVHGGSGSTLGALAAGVPLVVVPLFADQPQNARRVAEVGAGIAVEPDREDIHGDDRRRCARRSRRSSPEPSYGERARALAAELRAEPPVDEAVPLSERLASPLSSSVWPSTRLSTSPRPSPGQVWLLADNPREPELVFDFRVQRGPERGRQGAAAALVRLAPQALARARAPARGQGGRGAARPVPGPRAEPGGARLAERLGPLARRLHGRRARRPRPLPRPDAPGRAPGGARARRRDAGDGRMLFPFSAENADAPAAARRPAARRPRRRVRALAAARRDAAGRRDDASSSARTASPTSRSSTSGTARRRPPSASSPRRTRCTGPGRFFLRDAPWGVAVPADPALAPQLTEFIEAHPEVHVEEPARELLEELVGRVRARLRDRRALLRRGRRARRTSSSAASCTRSSAPGVRYALARRRTFIADEQGLGKTVQALATIE